MMIRKIDHVSIVARDIDKMTSLFATAFGFEVSETLTVPEQGFRSTLMHKEGVVIELVEPLDAESPMAKFLGNRESALHHFSLQVDSIEKEPESLKAKGIRMVSEKPFQPSEMARTNFIHPSSMGGILIELIERS
jgi:methylmalonyl-CoA/ethylmalonyl-CoA epimerase